MREGDGAVEPGRADELSGFYFMGRVHVGIQEGYGYGGHPLFPERLHGIDDIFRNQRFQHLAVGQHPFPDFKPAPARHKRRIGDPEHVIPLFPRTLADLQDIAETAGGQQSHDGTLAFEQSIQSHCRAMEKVGG